MVKVGKNMRLKGVRISHNKRLFLVIILLFILIIFLFVIIRIKERQEVGCKVDSDCVKQQVSCCPCNMGGQERCMREGEAREQQKKLGECEQGILCIAVYNCKDISCKCKQGNCTEE